ncbi:hypothetical protein JYU34_009362 [Plutella xylostella]|uniref:Uncharacterized protein n=1 Tax=Plutella xylostella TaxID=51655 RepID=A0ABQ7QJ93_PLUXY|nr:hypothetical protein JYU34_009362 [Plutella xylostella]
MSGWYLPIKAVVEAEASTFPEYVRKTILAGRFKLNEPYFKPLLPVERAVE